MFRIAVCDDEEIERVKIKDLIGQYSFDENVDIFVDCFTNGEELLNIYQKGKYDMVFLDIEMGQVDGLAVADRIRSLPDHDVTIMYVTNYPEYMQQSFDVRAAQFFSKPIKYEIFKDKMNKVINYIRDEEDKKVIFYCNGAESVVSLSDICTIETVKSMTRNNDILVTTLSEKINAKGKLQDYVDKYNVVLVYAHRSVLVNINNIFRWSGTTLVMKNGQVVEVSRNRKQELKELFSETILRRIGR